MLQSSLLTYNPVADACYKLFKAGAESYYNIYNSETDTKDYASEAVACYKLYNTFKLYNPETDACYKVTYLLITLRLTLVARYIMPGLSLFPTYIILRLTRKIMTLRLTLVTSYITLYNTFKLYNP